jgi:hypothetical protein
MTPSELLYRAPGTTIERRFVGTAIDDVEQLGEQAGDVLVEHSTVLVDAVTQP